jgi:hypothetical protein
MDDGEGVTLTGKQLRGLVFLLVFAVLFVSLAGYLLRADESPSLIEEYAAAVATASARADDGEAAERAAELEEGFQVLLGGGDMYTTSDFNALDKSLGDTVTLRAEETELRVTPARVTAGPAACASGSVMTVELLVERVSGAAGLTPATFALLAADGAATAPVPGCSTGFAESAGRRTLVFAAEKPDRLIVGTDPSHPVAVWHLP